MSIRCSQARPGGKARAWTLQGWASAPFLSVVVGLSGCAGTPLGETLSGSFPTPPGPGTQVPEPAPEAAPATMEGSNSPLPPSAAASPPGGGRAPVPGTSSPGSTGLGSSAAPSSAPGSKKPPGASAGKPLATQAKPTPLPTAPSPYRVTIRLPQADPSAPAEGVTQALRSAGIPFEVETIERVKGAAASQPEAAQGTAAAPAVRPAPPPR